MIIINGLQGTGKTTLAKKISEALDYDYINDYEILKNGCFDSVTITNLNKNQKSILNQFIENNVNKKIVLDMCYSLPINLLKKYNSQVKIIVLGFANIDPKILQSEMQKKSQQKIFLTTAKSLIRRSQQTKIECESSNLTFHEIGKNREEIINNIFNQLKNEA